MDLNLIIASLILAVAVVAAAFLQARLSRNAWREIAQSLTIRQAENQSREAAMALRRQASVRALSAVAASVAQVRALRDASVLPPAADAVVRLQEACEGAKSIASPASAVLFDQYVALFTQVSDRLLSSRGPVAGTPGAALPPGYRSALLDALPQLSALANNLLLAVRKDFGFAAQSEHMLWQQLNKTSSSMLAGWRSDIEGGPAVDGVAVDGPAIPAAGLQPAQNRLEAMRGEAMRSEAGRQSPAEPEALAAQAQDSGSR